MKSISKRRIKAMGYVFENVTAKDYKSLSHVCRRCIANSFEDRDDDAEGNYVPGCAGLICNDVAILDPNGIGIEPLETALSILRSHQ